MNRRFLGGTLAATLFLLTAGSVLAQDTTTTSPQPAASPVTPVVTPVEPVVAPAEPVVAPAVEPAVAPAVTPVVVPAAEPAVVVTPAPTVTQTVQNADGSWSVIEYPVGKEVVVDLMPTTVIPGATGTARVRRIGDSTTINLDIKGLSGDTKSFNLYAVDALGKVTLLGPVTVTNGLASVNTTTPLNRFMMFLSPETNLTAMAPETRVILRSAVPQGYAVVPLTSSGERDGAAVGEKVAATSTAGATSSYSAPLLGIGGFRRGTDTEMKINFTGALTGSRANVSLEPRNDGPTTIVMRFHELKDSPAGKVLVLWAVSPENKLVRLGQVVNTGKRNEAEIQTETSLPDFGLFVTLENTGTAPGTGEGSTPTGEIVGTINK